MSNMCSLIAQKIRVQSGFGLQSFLHSIPGEYNQFASRLPTFEKSVGLLRFGQGENPSHMKLKTTRIDETGQFGKGRIDEFRFVVKKTPQIETLHRMIEG